METRAYRLAMRTPLHVGERGIGVEETLDYVPSDSLFSALAVTWLRMAEHRDTLDGLQEKMEREPLLLTSAFPFIGSVLLFPKPQLGLAPDSAEGESGKEYKRVRWVSTDVFSALLNGPEQPALDGLWAARALLQDNSVWVTQAESERLQGEFGFVEPNRPAARHVEGTTFWNSMRVPKVTVDRLTNASQIFHVGRVHFATGCGLWFMAQGEETRLDRVEAALNLLADDGLGGQRSRGNGQFTWAATTPPPLPQVESGYRVLLSRLAPRETEMALLRAAHASYQLTLIGGFSGTPHDPPLIRRQVRMLVEGSVIGAAAPQADGAESRAVGGLVDVTPTEAEKWLGHPIFRYGYGFTAPIAVKEGA